MDNRKKLKIFNVLYMRRLRVFFYFSCAGRIVTCYDDDDQISCGCICDLKIFAVFIELCTVFHHVYSCSIFSCAGRTVNCSDDDD